MFEFSYKITGNYYSFNDKGLFIMCQDMKTWLLNNKGKIFRYVIYRRMFTPYEQKSAFVDESQFEDTHFTIGFIEEAIDLNGEWLLGFRKIDEDNEISDEVEFCRLTEIRLSCFDSDQL